MHDSFWYYGLASFGLILVGYFLVAGSMYWLFYSALGQTFANRRLHRSPPSSQAIFRDIKLSALSVVVFALSVAFVLRMDDAGTTLFYANLSPDRVWYWGASFVAVLILQDTYFYFIHRAFHHPQLFKRLHQGHHQSKDPTPWTAFALDLPDAIAQAIFLVGVVFIIPLHFTTLLAVLTTMALQTVVVHLGVELLPSSCHWFGGWLIDPTHHSVHHRKYKVHYGLYFTFWDKLLSTQDPSYKNQLGSSRFQSSVQASYWTQ